MSDIHSYHRLQERVNRLRAAIFIRRKLGGGLGDLPFQLRVALDALENCVQALNPTIHSPEKPRLENLIVPPSAIITRGCERPKKKP